MSNQNDAPESEMSDDDLDKIIAEMSAQEEHGASAKKFEVDAEVSEVSLQSEMSKLVDEKPAAVQQEQLSPVEEIFAKPAPIVAAPSLSVVPPTATPAPTTTPTPVSDEAQMLSMELTGALNLKLCFTGNGRKIEVHCTQDFLICRMADGTEFKIPTGIASRKVA